MRAWLGLGVGLLSFCCACSCAAGLALGSGGNRQFELVSPVYKGGFGAIHIEAVAPDGNSVAYYSPGVFAGAPSGLSGLDTLSYLARRNNLGWTSVSLLPPDALLPYVLLRDVSTGLDLTVAMGNPGPNDEAAGQESPQTMFLMHATSLPDTATAWEVGGMVIERIDGAPPTLIYEGASGDLCHLLFASKGKTGALLSQAVGTTQQLYELVRGCHGEPVSLRLVSLDDEGNIISGACKVDFGVEDYASEGNNSSFNAVSDNGDSIFFTSCIKNVQAHHQLFVRLAGERTLEVSKPLSDGCGENEIPCNGAPERSNADFVGASEDGSRVYFTTSARLSGEDNDNASDLYLADIGCPSASSCGASERRVTRLTQVSHNPHVGEAAGMVGVVRVAPDGSRAYFVATGDLLGEAERSALAEQGRAVPWPGAYNLYVHNSVSGRTSFIGDLCSGYELSGSTVDSYCQSKAGVDTGLWTINEKEAHTAGADGRYMVFSSYAQLAPSDTDTARDIYRYDSVTGRLDRVSAGENGYDADGNNGLFDATISPAHTGKSALLQHEMDSRAVSDDGSRVVFTSTEPLSPEAVNGLSNVYEWHEEDGRSNVLLVSGGSGVTPVEDVVISPGGGDVFFVTTEGLVEQDVDGAPDVYDARVGGGFPISSASRKACESDACQGPLTNPAALLVPGSISQVSGENPVRSRVTPAPKSRTTKQKSRHSKRKAHRKGRRALRSANRAQHNRGPSGHLVVLRKGR